MVGIYGKCENWDVAPEIFYFCVEYLKENFMMVIRELEMAWVNIRKIGIRISSEIELGLGFCPEIELGK